MRWFWRRKSLLVVTMLATGLVASLTFFAIRKSSARRLDRSSRPVVSRANAKAPRLLGHFDPVPGTSFLMADIYSGGDEGYLSGGGFSKVSGHAIHNYIFLDTTNTSTHRLLPSNDAYIRGVEQLPDGGGRPQTIEIPNDRKPDVRWLLFDVVKRDTDDDGDLGNGDLCTLAVSDAGGKDYKELIEGIRDIYGRALRNPDTLVVIYQTVDAKKVSVIDLPGRVVTSTVAISDLGQDVK